MTTDGQIPEQRYWSWNGRCWVPAHPAGTHSWDGTAWHRRDRRFWQPPWNRSDTTALVLWALVAPVALTAVTVAVTRRASLHGNAIVGLALVLDALWLLTGGATVRHRGRLRDQLVIAAVTVVVVATALIGWAATAVDPEAHFAVGISVAAGGCGLVLPTMLLVAAGRAARSWLDRRRDRPTLGVA